LEEGGEIDPSGKKGPICLFEGRPLEPGRMVGKGRFFVEKKCHDKRAGACLERWREHGKEKDCRVGGVVTLLKRGGPTAWFAEYKPSAKEGKSVLERRRPNTDHQGMDGNGKQRLQGRKREICEGVGHECKCLMGGEILPLKDRFFGKSPVVNEKRLPMEKGKHFGKRRN